MGLRRNDTETLYVLTLDREVLGVFLSPESAKTFVQRQTGAIRQWEFSNSHGAVWWSSRYTIQETSLYILEEDTPPQSDRPSAAELREERMFKRLG